MCVSIVLSGLVNMSAKDTVLRIATSRNSEEAKAFAQSMARADDPTARAVITQIKKMLKDKSIQPTVKLATLQIFHQCMGVNNMHFLLFAQKKVLRRLGEFARHRKTSADPGRGADIFGNYQGEQRAASIDFLQTLLYDIKSWATRFGIAPNGEESDYLRLFRALEAERVAFPADGRVAVSSPRAQVPRFEAELSKCKQTADFLTQQLAAQASSSQVSSTASQVSAYLVQLEVEIQMRSSQPDSEAELNLLLSNHDYLSKALDAYEEYKRNGSQDSKQTALTVTLNQTQASIDQVEQELSEIRNRIYLMRTSEDHSSPDQMRREVDTRMREQEEAHRTHLAQLSQPNAGLLEQQVADAMRQIEELQTALKQKTAELERDNKLYAQVMAENRDLARKVEEASRRAYVKVADSPPDSPEPQEPSFFSSARPSIDPLLDSPDLAAFQTSHSPALESPGQVDAGTLPIANEKEFRLLCLQEKGVLFEDATVKLGAQLQWTGSEGKCLVFVGNGSQEVLEGVAIQVIPVAGVDVQQESKVPTQVQPGQKATFTLQISVREPFTGCPRILVMYLLRRSPRYLHLKLPIVLARALQPLRSDPREAFLSWQGLADTEAQISFSSLQAGINSMNSLASAIRFRSNLQLYGVKELPELEKGTVLGLGSLGELVAVTVSVEGNAKSGKIAVRSHSSRLRDAMLVLLKEFIVGYT